MSPTTGATDPPGGASQEPFGRLHLERSSTVDRVVEELHRALFDGDLEPGTALREVALADAMGVSRSTIREALASLVAAGLATRSPNRGVHVTALDPGAIRDVSRARTVLEVAGVRRWRQADPSAREQVRAALASFTRLVEADAALGDLTAAHLAIHESFVALTGSPRLIAWAESLTSEVRLVLARVDRIRRNGREQVHSHGELLRLLEADDVDGAATELGRHLDHAETSMLTALGLG